MRLYDEALFETKCEERSPLASALVSLITEDLADAALPLKARALFLRPQPQFPGLTGDSAISLQNKMHGNKRY